MLILTHLVVCLFCVLLHW